MKTYLTIFCLAVLCGCSSVPERTVEAPGQTTEPGAESGAVQEKGAPHITLYVNADSSILLDNQPATFADVEKRLLKLRSEGGTVFYSRENQMQDPPEIAVKLIELVARQQLPVQFYTDKTFTKVADF